RDWRQRVSRLSASGSGAGAEAGGGAADPQRGGLRRGGRVRPAPPRPRLRPGVSRGAAGHERDAGCGRGAALPAPTCTTRTGGCARRRCTVRILALDTATENCSAALLIDGRLSSREALLERDHAARILPMVAELLSERGSTPPAPGAVPLGPRAAA